ncbi:MAG: 4'-phosphopantetheinyl transferase superfamily protein [Pseudomonadales bacterium]|nr:4'-phosphopantetheinyl transferase superfamily protein [Pseudomonadales bacterium]
MIDLIRRVSSEIQLAVAEDWMWETEAHPEEEAYITRAVEKRKREFRAGRHAAHKALEALGYKQSVLKVGEQRQPLWPEDIIGSISHTKGFCACAAASKGKLISIGIDVEPLSQVDAASLPLICTRKELQTIEQLQNTCPTPLCKLVFSAKECVHKVYHPLNGHTLDFLDAEIELDIENKSFTAHINNPEKKPPIPIKKLSGYFDYDDQFIYTVIAKTKD